MKKISIHILTVCIAGCGSVLTACSDDHNDDQTSGLHIDIEGNSTTIRTFRSVRLTAGVNNERLENIRWNIGDSLIGTTRSIDFIAPQATSYPLLLTAERTDGTTVTSRLTLTAQNPETPYTANIQNVLDYCPAPGQFVNKMPEYTDGDTPEQMNEKALQIIQSGSTVTLGSYGGYIVCGFDHTVANLAGYDLRIEGNSFEGNSEPGIVSVAFDRNKNGRPDADEWYELAGSEHRKGLTTPGYTVTYNRPAENHTPTPSPTDPFITDDTYIAWSDNKGKSGYLFRNQFHANDYFPRWRTGNSLTLTGTLLPGNAINTGTADAPNWILNAFEYGYADNLPNARSLFDIDNAIDQNGLPVKLPGIDFVRIQTGLLQYCGWSGNTSTDVSRIVDLHITVK